jgi:hypothetical protein
MSKRIPDEPDAKADGGLMELSLEDTLAAKLRGFSIKKRTAGGYSPYGAGPLNELAKGEKKPPKKVTDLRKLSEWIRQRREIEELKKKDRK